MHSVLVDTDVLIDVLRSIETTIVILQTTQTTSKLCISAVTQMELLVGCRNTGELQRLDRFLQPFEKVSLNEAISHQAIALLSQYRLSHSLFMPDALIAATSQVTGYALLTKNQRDYRFIQDLNLLRFEV